MAINEKLTNRVRKSMAGVEQVEEKKMFSGIAFMVAKKLCVSVGNDRIMCRIDPILHEELIQKKGCRTVIMKGRQYKGYVFVQEDSMPAKKDLDFWIGLALDFNKRAKASPKKKK